MRWMPRTVKKILQRMQRQSAKWGIEKIIAELGKKAGIQRRIYPHLIRHTTATMALQHGKKMLGHANIATTMIYAKAAEDQVKNSHKKYIA